jgi:hypothetical protein
LLIRQSVASEASPAQERLAVRAWAHATVGVEEAAARPRAAPRTARRAAGVEQQRRQLRVEDGLCCDSCRSSAVSRATSSPLAIPRRRAAPCKRASGTCAHRQRLDRRPVDGNLPPRRWRSRR